MESETIERKTYRQVERSYSQAERIINKFGRRSQPGKGAGNRWKTTPQAEYLSLDLAQGKRWHRGSYPHQRPGRRCRSSENRGSATYPRWLRSES